MLCNIALIGKQHSQGIDWQDRAHHNEVACRVAAVGGVTVDADLQCQRRDTTSRGGGHYCAPSHQVGATAIASRPGSDIVHTSRSWKLERYQLVFPSCYKYNADSYS